MTTVVKYLSRTLLAVVALVTLAVGFGSTSGASIHAAPVLPKAVPSVVPAVPAVPVVTPAPAPVPATTTTTAPAPVAPKVTQAPSAYPDLYTEPLLPPIPGWVSTRLGGAPVYTAGVDYKGTVILVHGLNTEPSVWTQGPYLTISTALIADGYRVVATSVVDDYESGAWLQGQLSTVAGQNAYLFNWYAQFNAEAIDAGNDVSVGGFSFGGYKAILAASQHAVAWYFAQEPPTSLSLVGVWAGVPTSIDLTPQSFQDLHGTPGWIGWGSADTITQGGYTDALGATVIGQGVPVTLQAFPGLDHEMSQGAANAIVAWIPAYVGW